MKLFEFPWTSMIFPEVENVFIGIINMKSRPLVECQSIQLGTNQNRYRTHSFCSSKLHRVEYKIEYLHAHSAQGSNVAQN